MAKYLYIFCKLKIIKQFVIQVYNNKKLIHDFRFFLMHIYLLFCKIDIQKGKHLFCLPFPSRTPIYFIHRQRRGFNRHNLWSKPTLAILLFSRERHFTAFPCLAVSANSPKFQSYLYKTKIKNFNRAAIF